MRLLGLAEYIQPQGCVSEWKGVSHWGGGVKAGETLQGSRACWALVSSHFEGGMLVLMYMLFVLLCV